MDDDDDEDTAGSAGFVEPDDEMAGVAELFGSEDVPPPGDVFSRLGSDPSDHDEDSDDEESEEDSDDEDADSDTDSSSTVIGYEELTDELLDRCGGRLSDREKSIVTLCLKQLGDSSFAVRDWYDRNK